MWEGELREKQSVGHKYVILSASESYLAFFFPWILRNGCPTSPAIPKILWHLTVFYVGIWPSYQLKAVNRAIMLHPPVESPWLHWILEDEQVPAYKNHPNGSLDGLVWQVQYVLSVFQGEIHLEQGRISHPSTFGARSAGGRLMLRIDGYPDSVCGMQSWLTVCSQRIK